MTEWVPMDASGKNDPKSSTGVFLECNASETYSPTVSTPILSDSLSIVKSILEPLSSALQAIVSFDSNCSLWMHKIGLKIPRCPLRLLEYSGDGLFWLPVSAAVWLTPMLGLSTIQDFFFKLLIGFLLDLIFVGTLKVLIRRCRPIYNKGMYLVVSVDHWSFPSGHSSRAFLIFSFFVLHSSLWKNLNGVQLRSANGLGDFMARVDFRGAYCIMASFVGIWAVATASSRIFLGRHYLLDVVAGSVLGVLEAAMVYKLLLSPGILSESHYQLLFKTKLKVEEIVLNF
eukprot:c24575_g1_i1 orf=255-1112(-)